MHELCLRHGEDRFAAVLIPLAVDGLSSSPRCPYCWPTDVVPAVVPWPGPCSWSAAWPASAPTSPSRSRV
ncbi:hypothetical protein [Nonomuraea sp. NPDC003214]